MSLTRSELSTSLSDIWSWTYDSRWRGPPPGHQSINFVSKLMNRFSDKALPLTSAPTNRPRAAKTTRFLIHEPRLAGKHHDGHRETCNAKRFSNNKIPLHQNEFVRKVTFATTSLPKISFSDNLINRSRTLLEKDD